MDTMLFRHNTCKTGNNAVKMSQVFHDVAQLECFQDLNLFNARVASGWVPMGEGAATAITPQDRRTPTGQPTHNPAMSPPAPVPVLHRMLGVYWVFRRELVFITSLYFLLTLAGRKWSTRSTWIAWRRWFRCKKLKQTMHDNFFFLL